MRRRIVTVEERGIGLVGTAAIGLLVAVAVACVANAGGCHALEGLGRDISGFARGVAQNVGEEREGK